MKKFVEIVVLVVVAIVIVIAIMRTHAPVASPVPLQNTVLFACSSDKTINATFYQGQSMPPTSAGGPPTPSGSVLLNLSDGRTMTLQQTISADGARYANADESVVFWNKGNGVTFTENGVQAYMGCIAVANDPGGLSHVYENGPEGFSLRYPDGFVVDESYQYQELGPGEGINGIKFTIPASEAAGTNLGADSYISVEEIPQAKTCTASLFLDQGVTASPVTDGNTIYSFASSTGAGAGNRYEETVYALPYSNPCVAVRYLIHYSVFENYPPGTVQQFDEQAIHNQFDSIRRTLTIAQ